MPDTGSHQNRRIFMQPKIGIVICGLEGNHQFVSNPYIQSVRYSHGLPLLLPLVRSEDLLNQYVSLCDGFLFCGQLARAHELLAEGQ